ncbi:Ribbon-helix-helix domain-containing protein [Roseivivax lentus]|uniref:Ribbon-helix-helix domain-containing protein n=1 Tax=Roseivivax lentus TaxID=633194 RepID=A0A1N7NNS0_9RHOB|nr:ribbon-helix-helix domain-containing protein [Roseivivax lentus]SIS99996.1 Ribbon-helix-helix domain-containing protein [Roseivivax lentus]
MTARPVKRSLTLRGHRTSVSLEDPFWQEFRAIAARQDKPINVLATEIDAGRGLDVGLASAIRLYVLADLKARVTG